MKFSDELGNIDYDGVARYIKQYIPNRLMKLTRYLGRQQSFIVFTASYPVGKSLVSITGIIDGWALNTEYFAEVLHDLRDKLKFLPWWIHA